MFLENILKVLGGILPKLAFLKKKRKEIGSVMEITGAFPNVYERMCVTTFT